MATIAIGNCQISFSSYANISFIILTDSPNSCITFPHEVRVCTNGGRRRPDCRPARGCITAMACVDVFALLGTAVSRRVAADEKGNVFMGFSLMFTAIISSAIYIIW